MALSEEQKKIIQKILRYYFSGKLKSKYRTEKRRGEQNYHPSATGNVKVGKGKGGRSSNQIERFIERKDQSEQLASFLKLFIDEMEDVLSSLNEDNLKVLKMTYNNTNYTDSDICKELDENVSKSTIRRRRKRTLKDIYDLINIDYYVDNPLKEIRDFFQRFLV